MELRAYLRTLISKWWIVLIIFLITYAATLAYTFTQKPVYESDATYVVKLNSSFSNDRDLASAVDILSRRTEIATTYTIVANSSLIKQAAADSLALAPAQRDDVTVSSQLVPGTNVLEIVVQSRDPVLARNFVNAVGAKMMTYVRDLYETYTIEPLDGANVPSVPIKPNKPLNLALGALMGLLLGTGMAFLAAYLQAPPENVTNTSMLDEETGVYNQRYLMLRLNQEFSRARRNSYPLALVLMNVDHTGTLDGVSMSIRREALRRVTQLLMPHLRDEDTLAHYSGNIFAFLLPDLTGEAAKPLVERLQAVIDADSVELPRSNIALDLRCSAGIGAYSASVATNDLEADALLEQALRSLKEAEAVAYSKVALASESEARPGATDVPSMIRA